MPHAINQGESMSTLLPLLGGLSSFFIFVMTIIAAVSLRKPRKISALSMLISAVIAFLVLLVMLLIAGFTINPLLVVPALLFGVLLGLVRGQLVKLSLVGQQVIGRNSILLVILWGFSQAISLLLGLFDLPIISSLGLLPVVLSTGLQIGYYLNLFLRRVVIHLTDPGAPPASRGRLSALLNLQTYPNVPIK
jgi:hypothetical protein